MKSTHTLLLEIGTEELPPAAIDGMTAHLGDALLSLLSDKGALDSGSASVRCLWGPRRMAVMIEGVREQLPDRDVERQGPFVDKAFAADGQPLPAALGFAKSCGVEIGELSREQSDKGERLVFRQRLPGGSLSELLIEQLAGIVDAIPVPKLMRWGEGLQSFVRPVHWLVCLLDDTVIGVNIKGCAGNRLSRGHRFHHTDAVVLDKAQDYVERLRAAQVIVCQRERRHSIEAQLKTRAEAIGLEPRIDPSLLDEVNALVEWPVVIDGAFDPSLLRVPNEALVACMQVHQKFFPLFDSQHKLANRFLAVANIDSRQPEAMRRGYEKVILPRLADAAFFFDEDAKAGFTVQNRKLAHVVFQETLGSVADKTGRIAQLAAWLSGPTGADPAVVEQASRFCKADLMSLMVGEFPELQGIMGHYYARLDNMPDPVGLAIEEHYLPRHASDATAQTPAGQCLALADRLDSLVGIFSVGMIPSGNKDPYALRRAAVGIIRSCLEHGIEFDLSQALNVAGKSLEDRVKVSSDLNSKVMEFIVERARNYCEEQRIAPKTVFSAAASGNWKSLFDLFQRTRALQAFYEREESRVLASADKRIRNILRKNQDQLPESINIDTQLMTESAERTLYEVANSLVDTLQGHAEAREHDAALAALTELAQPLERFFDQVMVMADDQRVRENRLALLQKLAGLMSSVGDLSQLNSG